MKRLAILTLLLFPATASAAHESTMAQNPALRADYAFAANYWGRKPHCNQLIVLTTSELWAPNEIGHAEYPEGACRIEVKWGIGKCRRRLVVMHEYGHLLRLRFAYHPIEQPEHSLDPTSIMFPAVQVVWAEHPELCPWTTPPPLPPYLGAWIESEEP